MVPQRLGLSRLGLLDLVSAVLMADFLEVFSGLVAVYLAIL